MNKQPKVMRRNRRFRIFLIWFAEIDALVIAKILFNQMIDTELAVTIVKCATVIAAVAITGLSGVHMVKEWACGKRGNIPELPEPSEEEEKTQ